MKFFYLVSVVWANRPDCQKISWEDQSRDKMMRICPEKIDVMQSDWPDNVAIPMPAGLSVEYVADAVRADPAKYFVPSQEGHLELTTKRISSKMEYSDERGESVTHFRGYYHCLDSNGRKVSDIVCYTDMEWDFNGQGAGAQADKYCQYVGKLKNLIDLVTNHQVGHIEKHCDSLTDQDIC